GPSAVPDRPEFCPKARRGGGAGRAPPPRGGGKNPPSRGQPPAPPPPRRGGGGPHRPPAGPRARGGGRGGGGGGVGWGGAPRVGRGAAENSRSVGCPRQNGRRNPPAILAAAREELDVGEALE